MIYVGCLNISYNNVVKGTRLLDKKAIFVYTGRYIPVSLPVKYIYWPFQDGTSVVLFLSCVCYAFARLFIDALWSPAGKGLTSWLSFVMSYYVFVIFPCSILGQVWYLIVSIHDICPLSYFS